MYYASAGSVLIYAAVGYFAFRRWSVLRTVGAALVVELVDATLAWFISWQIGPGALPAEQMTITTIAFTIVFLFVFAAVCAVMGCAIARTLHGRRTQANA